MWSQWDIKIVDTNTDLKQVICRLFLISLLVEPWWHLVIVHMCNVQAHRNMEKRAGDMPKEESFTQSLFISSADKVDHQKHLSM